jgi:hypothetical protein
MLTIFFRAKLKQKEQEAEPPAPSTPTFNRRG